MRGMPWQWADSRSAIPGETAMPENGDQLSSTGSSAVASPPWMDDCRKGDAKRANEGESREGPRRRWREDGDEEMLEKGDVWARSIYPTYKMRCVPVNVRAPIS